MKKASLSVFLIFIISNIVFALHLDGYCYLDDRTDHAGIEITFTPESGNNAPITSYTDAQGYYILEVEAGSYHITYAKDGFERIDAHLPNCTKSNTIPYFLLHRDYTYDLSQRSGESRYDHFLCGKGNFAADEQVTMEIAEGLAPEGEVNIYLVNNRGVVYINSSFKVEIDCNGGYFAVYRMGRDTSKEMKFFWTAEWDEEDE